MRERRQRLKLISRNWQWCILKIASTSSRFHCVGSYVEWQRLELVKYPYSAMCASLSLQWESLDMVWSATENVFWNYRRWQTFCWQKCYHGPDSQSSFLNSLLKISAFLTYYIPRYFITYPLSLNRFVNPGPGLTFNFLSHILYNYLSNSGHYDRELIIMVWVRFTRHSLH